MPAQTSSTESQRHTGLLAELPIAPGATTSRVVVNNELLRVVVFAMDEGQELTEHSSPRKVVVQMLDGTMDFTLDGETSSMTAGDVLYMAPSARHALVATSPCHFQLTMVDA